MVPNGGQQPQLFPPAQGGGFIGKLLTPVKKIAQHVFTPKSAAKSAGGGGNAGAGGVPGDDGDKDMGGSVEEKKNVEKKKPPPKARSHIPTEGLPWKDKNWKPKNDNDDQKPWKRKVKIINNNYHRKRFLYFYREQNLLKIMMEVEIILRNLTLRLHRQSLL